MVLQQIFWHIEASYTCRVHLLCRTSRLSNDRPWCFIFHSIFIRTIKASYLPVKVPIRFALLAVECTAAAAEAKCWSRLLSYPSCLSSNTKGAIMATTKRNPAQRMYIGTCGASLMDSTIATCQCWLATYHGRFLHHANCWFLWYLQNLCSRIHTLHHSFAFVMPKQPGGRV